MLFDKMIFSKKVFALFFVLFAIQVFAQKTAITVSGSVIDKIGQSPMPFVTVTLKNKSDLTFIMGTVTSENGSFTLSNVKPQTYMLELSFVGYKSVRQEIYVGSLSEFLRIPVIEMEEDIQQLQEVSITAKQDAVDNKMDKKTFAIADNISQSGGSVLQAMQNLPGVTIQDGKVQLRGSDKVAVLMDGKQTALTGFGNQNGLDNIPASAIERIEIINNPTAKYDANGNAGIINIIYKKSKAEGLNGKVGLAGGLGALWAKKQNLPTIRPQYQNTPKINPSLALNYRKNKTNVFLNADYLYTETLNKNEFTTRTYDDGSIINQQLKRNRNTHFLTTKTGVDFALKENNSLTISGLFGIEKIIDRGDEPFFNKDNSERLRLWQFLEDELKTTVMATAAYQHKYSQPGRLLNLGFNYTFHREDEKYFFDNIYPTFQGQDSFKLLSDESVFDFNADYVQPLKNGNIETGLKLRRRNIPTNMQFFQGLNSPLDIDAGGAATYGEIIPAAYSNYVYENPKIEAEIGLRVEYINLNYEVNPNHNTYKSGGYDYFQPFPNTRFAWKINANNKLSFFYNRRVDRPNEVDIRIFPKYDDAEIIKVGNPNLAPQFTNTFELGYKTNISKGYFYSAVYHRIIDGTITRIASVIPPSPLIYAIFQNAGRSYNSGLEMVLSEEISKAFSFNINGNIYRNQIDAFTVNNLYPEPNIFSTATQRLVSGNVKANFLTHFKNNIDWQVSAVYLAPDLIPQGKIGTRFSVDTGLKKTLKNGEIYLNATDLLNTMVIKREIQGAGFSYVSNDYYETQVVRLGYSRKF
ncbi:Outer membrane receptor proteins, mostly Fe transport [Spirosomataceae bacterium TFI 002]|nr:Outer membrane receptor proteins, mostly Fe transport [Spirosomataceae bacterium TFI 002]